MVTGDEFLRIERKLENMQLVNEILFDSIRALEKKLAELTVRKQSSMCAIDLSTSKEITMQSQGIITNTAVIANLAHKSRISEMVA
ncbi:hypothetical protein ACH5RR_013116 [Cinchona calisaya]|uniref:Uncharacterized protein n=1 Tax=Cinchona calisaya TaxID=153742 RepID=A0ABD2ZZ50_9GENT